MRQVGISGMEAKRRQCSCVRVRDLPAILVNMENISLQVGSRFSHSRYICKKEHGGGQPWKQEGEISGETYAKVAGYNTSM